MELSEDSEEEKLKATQGEKAVLANMKIRRTDFTKTMILKIGQYADKALSGASRDKDCATILKQLLMKDSEFQGENDEGTWQIFIGKSFGAAITYDTFRLIHFDLKSHKKTLLVFKTQ